jgi:short-subunit dehydrogenase
MTSVPSVGTNGGSTGIGSVYTDLFAKRIHHLISAVRDRARKEWSTNVED